MNGYGKPRSAWVRRPAARGRVWKIGDTWHYAVRVGEMVVFADNTGAWVPMLDACLADVRVADRIVTSGHGFRRSWGSIVDEAMAA